MADEPSCAGEIVEAACAGEAAEADCDGVAVRWADRGEGLGRPSSEDTARVPGDVARTAAETGEQPSATQTREKAGEGRMTLVETQNPRDGQR